MFWRVVTWPKPREYCSARRRPRRVAGGSEQAVGDLDPEHLHVHLTLPVDPAQEPERPELFGVQLTALEGLELADELVDVAGVRELGEENLLRS